MQGPNDVHYRGARFAKVPHELIMDTKNAKAIALYAILAKFADWSTMEAHPSVATLAKLMGYSSRKAVDEALAVLTEQGWVEVFPRWIVESEDGESSVVYERPEGKGWRQTSNGYVLNDHPTKEGTPSPIGNPPPVPEGTHPPAPEGTRPLPYRGHEQEPNEQEPVEPERADKPQAELAPPSKPKNSRGIPLPEGWLPERAVIDQMRAECPTVDLEAEHRKFTDYWAGVPGQRGRKKDWNATWRNWIRRAAEYAPRSSGVEDPMEIAKRLAGQVQTTIFDDEQKGIGQ